MFADAIRDAIGSMKLPRGFFALLQGRRHGLSAALVKHADITAVGFTGSLKAGRALFDVAAARPSPIPVFAEMGSLNPLVVMPEAMIERGADIARGLAASLLLGGGQFCTKPGVVLLVRNDVDIVDLLAREVAATKAVTMLNASLCGHFSSRVGEIASVPGVKTLIRGEPSAHAGATPTLLETTAQTFIGEPRLREEMFGPAGLLVRCRDVDEAIACLDAVGGSLTGTVHHGALDATGDVRRIIRKLQQIAGRVIVNGYPTGVEVCNAIVHGGPYPATTDPSSTSVGSAAIRRWVRMAAYQDVPDALLPPALQNANPLSIERIVNGTRTREPVSKSS